MTGLIRRPGFWAALVCLGLCGGLLLAWSRAGRGLESQREAERWQAGEDSCAQVSAFISEDAALTDAAVMGAHTHVTEELSAVLGSPEAAEAAWTDAWCAESYTSVTGGFNTRQVRVLCTGGDWFAFHPLDVGYGWYYAPYDVIDGLAVLDELLAWQLFGAADVTGMEVLVNGHTCTVAGVVSVPEAEREAYGDEPALFVSYEFFSRVTGETPAVTCYEAALPEAVKGFAQDTVSRALGLGEGMCELRRNTGRFSFGRSLSVMGELPQRSQRTGRIYYPFWENAARAAESRAGLYAAGALAAALWPAGYGVWWAIRGIRRLRRR